jgi:MFS family permease
MDESSGGKKSDRRIVVPALGITQILAWGSTFYLLGVLAKPIVEETGWRYDWVIAGVCVGLLAAGVVSPRVGRTIGERGGRPVLALGTLLLAGGLVLLGLTRNPALYFCAWIVVGLGMGAGLYDAAFATLGAIYGKDARPAITSVTLFGGFASTVCWPLSAFLVAELGWRGACFAYAAIQVLISLPILMLALPRKKPPHSAGAAATVRRNVKLEPSERLVFGLLALVLTISSAILSLMGIHLLPLLQARGLELAAAVALGTLVGPSQVGARVIEMFFGRHYHPIWTMVASTTLVALGAGILFAGWHVYALAILVYGTGNGLSSVVRGTLPLALFGPARYPALMGRLGFPTLFAMALAPLAGGIALQLGGANVTLGLLLGLAGANVVLVWVLLGVSRARQGDAA